ncbi:hypothetical protein RJT34_16264 [Clitoria ternatea]|uniref:Uncharacterized protein n=1 Tax=Clitoria ternatea TaxID=43366 RepID=A0AAN9J813_CLITE
MRVYAFSVPLSHMLGIQTPIVASNIGVTMPTLDSSHAKMHSPLVWDRSFHAGGGVCTRWPLLDVLPFHPTRPHTQAGVHTLAYGL